MTNLDLLIELSMLKTVAEEVFILIQQSTDDNLKRKVVDKLMSMKPEMFHEKMSKLQTGKVPGPILFQQ